MKYITIKVSGIIIQIAKEIPTSEKGIYSEGVLEAFLPDSGELSDEEANKWIAENNKRMTAICDFMNRENL